ncbi:C2 domain of PTEN tumor-suppressor protein [Carpediemonas membranifera]|uniref:C2 domain of PTEN tumor-suppressor protein n=1 Tax=Carpediemonas membranifera TaxID=201153 RepID=A0A8J6B0B8_9EUKA|nr:C2 domain of PTEN tumor-suppressor protein [Carpediemonas membranifera]|eukprot:KAG9390257.1 C2 domain of PTEN tumor-suppressor protein [Carpediemonas membranifera]
MGFPAAKSEALYRNDINEVAAMLERHHRNHYLIYNLSERPYDYTKFDNQVLEFGFPDHHSPPLSLLFKICKNIYSWLSADPDNVVIVHCLAGRGRTGTVIACFLAYAGLFTDPMDALTFFACKRSAKEQGVSVPSQVRYVGYFHQVLKTRIAPAPTPIAVLGITLSHCPAVEGGLFRPVVQISSGSRLIFNSAWMGDPEPVEPGDTATLSTQVSLLGDISIVVKHKPMKSASAQAVARAAFHTSFVSGDTVEFPKNQLDKAVKDRRVHPAFTLSLRFKTLPQDGPLPDTDDPFDYDVLMPAGKNDPSVCFRTAPLQKPVPRLSKVPPTELHPATSSVTAVTMDGLLTWSGHDSGEVSVCAVSGEIIVATYKAHTRPVVAISVQGARAVSVSEDGTMAVFKLPLLWERLSDPEHASRAAAEAPDNIIHLDPRDGMPLCVSLYSRSAVIGYQSGRVTVISTDDGVIEQALMTHTVPVRCVCHNQSGSMFTGDDSGLIVGWSSSMEEAIRMQLTEPVTSLSTSSKRVAAVAGELRTMSADTLASEQILITDTPAVSVICGPDGFIYSSTVAGNISVHDPSTGLRVLSVELQHTTFAVNCSGASSGELLLGHDDGSVSVHKMNRK